MKKLIIILVPLLLCLIAAFSQTDSIPLYKKFPNVPPFSIMKTPDSTKFTKDNLIQNVPVIMIVFSPDCEHCQHETEALIKNIDLFKNTQIIMTSPLDYSYLLKFYKDYGIAKCPNITIGRDGSYMLGTFFSIHDFPSIFVYDKNWDLVKSFSGSVRVEKIAAALYN